jgi:hypothetical protein
VCAIPTKTGLPAVDSTESRNVAEVVAVHDPSRSVEVDVEIVGGQGVGARGVAVLAGREVARVVGLGVAPEQERARGDEADGQDGGDAAGDDRGDPSAASSCGRGVRRVLLHEVCGF